MAGQSEKVHIHSPYYTVQFVSKSSTSTSFLEHLSSQLTFSYLSTRPFHPVLISTVRFVNQNKQPSPSINQACLNPCIHTPYLSKSCTKDFIGVCLQIVHGVHLLELIIQCQMSVSPLSHPYTLFDDDDGDDVGVVVVVISESTE